MIQRNDREDSSILPEDWVLRKRYRPSSNRQQYRLGGENDVCTPSSGLCGATLAQQLPDEVSASPESVTRYRQYWRACPLFVEKIF